MKDVSDNSHNINDMTDILVEEELPERDQNKDRISINTLLYKDIKNNNDDQYSSFTQEEKKTNIYDTINKTNLPHKEQKEKDLNSFECSICLDVAKEPVVTKCGHLFCWPCIYKWNEQRKTCPNCNNPIDKKDCIPIYNKDQNNKNTNRFKIPERPKGERNTGTNINNNQNSNNNFFNNMNFGVGLFGLPFFGMSFNLAGGNVGIGGIHNNPLNNIRFSNNENVNVFLRNLLFMIVMMWIFFRF